MATVRDILGDALMELGILDPSETIDAGAANSALRELNRMIQSWNTEELMVYTVDRQTFPLVVNKQFYTIGTGGDFNVPRPVTIEMASVLVNGVELEVNIYNDEEWRDTSVKSVNSTFPLAMWPNGNYPLNTLAMWPIPQQVNDLVLYTWGQVSAFSTINATISLPSGYEDALVKNLGVRLSSRYGIAPSQVLVADAVASKSKIKAINWDQTYRSADPVLLGNGTAADVWRRSRGYVLD